jgi:hypothetical protein
MATITTASDVQAECGMDPSSLSRIGAWQQALVDGGPSVHSAPVLRARRASGAANDPPLD